MPSDCANSRMVYGPFHDLEFPSLCLQGPSSLSKLTQSNHHLRSAVADNTLTPSTSNRQCFAYIWWRWLWRNIGNETMGSDGIHCDRHIWYGGVCGYIDAGPRIHGHSPYEEGADAFFFEGKGTGKNYEGCSANRSALLSVSLGYWENTSSIEIDKHCFCLRRVTVVVGIFLIFGLVSSRLSDPTRSAFATIGVVLQNITACAVFRLVKLRSIRPSSSVIPTSQEMGTIRFARVVPQGQGSNPSDSMLAS